MKYKKNFFSVLEKIEKKKIANDMINIKELFLREKQNVDQLNILINFQKEYLQNMHQDMILGISVNAWQNYNNFIFMLDETIQKNLYFLENNKKIIKESLKSWSQSQIKLNIWINFNRIHHKNISKIQKIKEQIINDHSIQLKFFNKDNYANVRNNQ